MMKISRRKFVTAGSGAAISAPFIANAQAAQSIQWRMVTSWPKGLPGPGQSADRIAQRINTMSDGRLKVTVYAAGELAPALQVFDTVVAGAAEVGHTASLYVQGKMKAAAFFTTVPFGMLPQEHAAWIVSGGGQVLWEELYQPFGVRPFMAGNPGVQMGGWYKKPLNSLADLKGLKIRMVGMGGEIIRRMGATPVTVAAGEILPALQSGTIDAAEFLNPGNDVGLGFHKVAKNYYWPGFAKPNGTSEMIISQKAWEALPQDLKMMVQAAAEAEVMLAQAQSDWRNGQALNLLRQEHGVQVLPFPTDIIKEARTIASELRAEVASQSDIAKKISESYEAFLAQTHTWSRLSTAAVVNARDQGA